MGDVNDDVTTVLERAKRPAEGQPAGAAGLPHFAPSYDTTRIAGTALLDPNFNRNTLDEEGSGTDIVRYHVPVNGVVGALTRPTGCTTNPCRRHGTHRCSHPTARPSTRSERCLAAQRWHADVGGTGEVGVGPLGLQGARCGPGRCIPRPNERWMDDDPAEERCAHSGHRTVRCTRRVAVPYTRIARAVAGGPTPGHQASTSCTSRSMA